MSHAIDVTVYVRSETLAYCPFVCRLPLPRRAKTQSSPFVPPSEPRIKAVELSRSALRESPSNAQLWTLRGIALASKGAAKQALKAFKQALKLVFVYRV